MASLKQQRNTFFDRVWLPTASLDRMEQIIDDARQDAQVINELGSILKTKNLNWQCPSCEFFKICQAELNGSDVDFIRKAHYTQEATSNAREEREDD